MKRFALLWAVLLAAVVAGIGTLAADGPLRGDAGRPEVEQYREWLRDGGTLTDAEKARYLDLEGAGRELCDGPNPLDNQGGPDAFGYRFVDNQEPDTATFDWIELRDDPEATWLRGVTDFTSIDDGRSRLKAALGFPFPFYTATHDCVSIATNGFLQFTTTAMSLSNVCLPSTAVAGPMIAMYWNDLHLLRGGRLDTTVVGYKSFGDHFVITFDSVGNYSTSCVGTLTFQAILYSDGRIKLQYEQLILGSGTTCDSTATIGIQENGAAGSSALNYVCNLTGIQPVEQLAIWFYPAGSGSVSGTVTDEDNAPLTGALVRIEEYNMSAVTDETGSYSFPIAGIGTVTMTATKFGYDTDTVNGVVIVEDSNTVVDFTLESQGMQTYEYAGPPVPVADGVDSAFAPIEVPDDFEFTAVYVVLNDIQHTWDSDMDIYLRGPDGTTVELSTDNGSSGDNYIMTVFDDAGPCVIGTTGCNTAPFTGTYRPEGLLATFLGLPSAGEWTLVIDDDLSGFTGTINSWTLLLAGSIGPRGTIAGSVRRHSNSQPMEGVTVVAANAEETDATMTDAEGLYELEMPVGSYSLTFSYAGFCDSVITGVEVLQDSVTQLNMRLRNPVASASASSITQSCAPDDSTTATFTLNNTGNCGLTFTISDNQPWLSAAPEAGTIAPGGNQPVTLTFNATGLPVGEYNATLTVAHNAANTPLSIPVMMLVILLDADEAVEVPAEYSLAVYPNPFNPATTLRFGLVQAGRVTVDVYDVTGRRVRTLADGTYEAGYHAVTFDARELPSGLYLAQIRAGEFVRTEKMVLMK